MADVRKEIEKLRKEIETKHLYSEYHDKILAMMYDIYNEPVLWNSMTDTHIMQEALENIVDKLPKENSIKASLEEELSEEEKK